MGRAYYESGRFNDAAREFQQAYDLSRRPALLYNIFVSHRDAGNLGPAIQALRAYLELVPDAEDREQLTSRLAAMERLQRERGGDSQAPTTEPTTTVEPAASRTSEPTSPTPPSSASQGGGTWTPGWIVAAIGGAAVVAGLVTGGLALGAQGSLQAICDDAGVCEPGFESTRDSLALYSGLTDGLLFGGLAVAATGVVLALVISEGRASSDTPRAGFFCGPDGCAGTVRGFFRARGRSDANECSLGVGVDLAGRVHGDHEPGPVPRPRWSRRRWRPAGRRRGRRRDVHAGLR